MNSGLYWLRRDRSRRGQAAGSLIASSSLPSGLVSSAVNAGGWSVFSLQPVTAGFLAGVPYSAFSKVCTVEVHAEAGWLPVIAQMAAVM